MRLRINDHPEDETKDLECGDSTLKLRRLTIGVHVQNELEATVDGVLDAMLLEMLQWRHILAGWSGVLDSADKEIPYSPEAAAYIDDKVSPRKLFGVGPGLPFDIGASVRRWARAAKWEGLEQLGNSPGSSPSEGERAGTRGSESGDGEA